MKRFRAYSCFVEGLPNDGDILPNNSDFDSIESAFSAIKEFKKDPVFGELMSQKSNSDFVLDIQERKLYYMPSHGIPEEVTTSPEYIENLIRDIQN